MTDTRLVSPFRLELRTVPTLEAIRMPERQADGNASIGVRLKELGRLIRSDARADGYTRPLTVVARALTTIRFQAVVLYRLAHLAHQYSPGLASLIKYLNSVLTGCDIAAGARIGPDSGCSTPAAS